MDRRLRALRGRKRCLCGSWGRKWWLSESWGRKRYISGALDCIHVVWTRSPHPKVQRSLCTRRGASKTTIQRVVSGGRGCSRIQRECINRSCTSNADEKKRELISHRSQLQQRGLLVTGSELCKT
ncbi:hypothetical protein NDU88_012652 [Pleurodeles waltl]|uniref:Uncharacterized protein n=1 Tax=Pleurodeles waltl TaxID=8319 RepID=A0AAV7R6Q3_PLEWA|nr:hypothetical protein NDU88_012652 [Pleurodeles waltl]